MVPSLEPGQSDTDQPSKRALADFKAWEKELNVIMDQIAVLVLENSSQKALDKMKDCFKIRKRMVEIEDWSAADKEHHLRPLLSKLGWYQAEVLTACSKYDEAVTVYNNLLDNLTASTKEEQASVLLRVIVLHRRRGAYQTTLTFLHRLLDDLPDDSGHLRVAALNEAAACHVQLGRWDTAYKYCQMILQDAPYSAKAAFNSLVALVAMKAPENKLQQSYTKLLGVQLPVSLDKRPSSSAPGQLSVGQMQDATSRLWPKIQ
ncbi:hypothetical protein RvY_08731-5 [Ramazzottius varieornatus]|nr:hypothetical protein RvY_08731-5 [Ramazzottius varieornatus]